MSNIIEMKQKQPTDEEIKETVSRMIVDMAKRPCGVTAAQVIKAVSPKYPSFKFWKDDADRIYWRPAR
jgi:hypothetical protein